MEIRPLMIPPCRPTNSALGCLFQILPGVTAYFIYSSVSHLHLVLAFLSFFSLVDSTSRHTWCYGMMVFEVCGNQIPLAFQNLLGNRFMFCLCPYMSSFLILLRPIKVHNSRNLYKDWILLLHVSEPYITTDLMLELYGLIFVLSYFLWIPNVLTYQESLSCCLNYCRVISVRGWARSLGTR